MRWKICYAYRLLFTVGKQIRRYKKQCNVDVELDIADKNKQQQEGKATSFKILSSSRSVFVIDTMSSTKMRIRIVAAASITILVIIYFYKTVIATSNEFVQTSGSQHQHLATNVEEQRPWPPTENAEQRNLQIAYEAQNAQLHQQRQELLHTKEQLAQLEEQVRSLQASTPRKYPKVKYLNYKNRKRILITGGAGFVGSHLVDDLMIQGHEVIVVDNFFTGRKRNVEHWLGHENFELIHHDIVNPLFIEIDEIYHLASPASPPHYMYNPVKTIKTNTMGTINVLGLAKRVMAKVLIASTSEVYGDPTVHPQPETYWGHVNPIGPRACYDEGKRVSETLSYAYAKQVSFSAAADIMRPTLTQTKSFFPDSKLECGHIVQ